MSGGFRAPTLNELYRQFPVGTRLDAGQRGARPGALIGGEVGVSVAPAGNLTVRATWFDNRVKNPVSNVTLTTTPRCHAAAAEPRPDAHPGFPDRRRVPHRRSDWRVSGAYLYNQAKVTDGERVVELPALVGQVPRAGAEAPRVVPGRVHESAVRRTSRSACSSSAASSTTIRTFRASRSNGCAVQADAVCDSRVCRAIDASTSRVSRDVTATSRCSSACRTCSTRLYFVQTQPDDHRHAAPGERRASASVSRAVDAGSAETLDRGLRGRRSDADR